MLNLAESTDQVQEEPVVGGINLKVGGNFPQFGGINAKVGGILPC